MAAAPRDVDNHSRQGSGVVIAVIMLALVALLLSAIATAGRAQEIGDPRAGRAYAQRMCAECHAVLASQTASPNPRATAFKVVANTPGMTGTAIAVWLRTPHPTMPNLIVAGDDIENLVSYILDLRDKK